MPAALTAKDVKDFELPSACLKSFLLFWQSSGATLQRRAPQAGEAASTAQRTKIGLVWLYSAKMKPHTLYGSNHTFAQGFTTVQ